MRSPLWIGALLVAVFGIGWKSSRLMATDAPSAVQPSDGRRTDSGMRRGGSPFGGPFFGSPEQLVAELDLDDAQRSKLEAILEASTRRIGEYGNAIHELKEQTRKDVLALLTDAQRATLERKYDEAMERRSRESVDRDLEWLRSNTPLAADTIRGVEAILTQYEADKRAVMRPSCVPGAASGRPDDAMWNEVRTLREKRDAALAQALDPATLTRFQEERGRGRGRPPGPDGHSHRDSPSRAPGSQP